MSTTDMDRVRQDLAPDDPEGNGSSVADRAAEDVPETELFPLGTLDGDPKITFSSLMRKGKPVKVTASLRAAEVPVIGGTLLDPEKAGEVLVSFIPEQAVLVYERDTVDGPIKSYKIRQPLRPTYVQDASDMYSRAQVVELLEQVGASSDTISELLG